MAINYFVYSFQEKRLEGKLPEKAQSLNTETDSLIR